MFFQDPISWGATVFHTTSGNHRELPPACNGRASRRLAGWRVFVGVSLAPLAVLLATGCAELEPMGEPETLDHQVLVSGLQGVIREHERTMAELRAELDTRRQEYSAVLIANAQLEGRLRDVERRLNEARHIIDLQREELALNRTPRERVRPSRSRGPAKPKAVPVPTAVQPPAVESPPPQAVQIPDPAFVPPIPNEPMDVPAPIEGPAPIDVPASVLEGSAGFGSPPGGGTPILNIQDSVPESSVGSLLQSIAVRAGDTLFSLARRYGVDLNELRTANGLQDDLIRVGQSLILPPARVQIRR